MQYFKKWHAHTIWRYEIHPDDIGDNDDEKDKNYK